MGFHGAQGRSLWAVISPLKTNPPLLTPAHSMPQQTTFILVCSAVVGLVALGLIGYLSWNRSRAPGVQGTSTTSTSPVTCLSGLPLGPLPEIDDKLQAELDRLAAEGDGLAKAGKHQEAIEAYRRGFDLIPPPREGRHASLWFITAIGDAQWFAKDYTASLDTWRDAIILYGGFGNPFVHLRRGQTLYELDQKKEAANELLRALLLGGEAVFKTEHRKYWTFITIEARPPEGYPTWDGWSGLSRDSPLYHQMMNPEGVYQFSAKNGSAK